MPIYYTDSAGSNTAPYDTWAKAATSILTIEALVLNAGDIVYARGSQTISGAGVLTLAASGTNLAMISVIGCDAAGTPNAGQFTLLGDVGNLPAHLVVSSAKTYRRWENITFSGATNRCVYCGNNETGWQWESCIFENSADGISTGSNDVLRQEFEDCIFRNFTSEGVHQATICSFKACAFYNCAIGLNLNNPSTVENCLFRENSDDHIDITTSINNWTIISGCTFDSSSGGSGIKIADACGHIRIRWCRFTNNNQYAIEVVANPDVTVNEDYNGFRLNAAGNRLNIAVGPNSVDLGADGYVDAAADNYSLADAAEQRRVPINLDWA